MTNSFLGLDSAAWAAFAAIASFVSAFAAYSSTTAFRRTADVTLINQLNSKHDELDKRLIEAQGANWDEEGGKPHPWNHVVIAWLNHVELTAQLLNDRLVGKGARKFIKPLLIEWLSNVSRSLEIQKIMTDSISGPTTYSEIRKFVRRHKRELTQLNNILETTT